MPPRRPPQSETLPGMPSPLVDIPQAAVAREDFNPDRRRAFGSVPGLLRIEFDHEAALSDEDMLHISPAYLTASLYGKRAGRSVDGLTLNEAEYATLVTHMPTFLERVGARALKAHGLSGTNRQYEVERRAKMHALDRAAVTHAPLVAGVTREVGRLGELKEYIRTPGYARTDEANLRSLAADAWNTSFTNLLRVTGQQRHWNEDEKYRAAQAMQKTLSTGPQRDRVSAWKALTEVAYVYATRRRALFTQRSHVIDSQLKIVNKELQEFYDRTGFFPL